MTVITGARATAGTVTGVAGGVRSAVTGDLATGTVYGLPGVVRTAGDVPAAVPSTSPDAVTARVLDWSGAFIANLPKAQGLRWVDEFNTAGAGSIDYRRYDDVETAHPALWAPGNQVMVAVGGRDVFRLVLDSQGGYRIDGDTGDRIDSWAGTGALGILNSGMCIPEYGWRPEATEDRTFDYGSDPDIGGWFVASEWHTPVGRLVRKSWRWIFKKRHLPKGFKDRKAQWLWYRDPDSTTSANETCWLVGDPFTLSAPRRVRIKVCGDDTLEFQLDGEIRATTGPGGWKKATTVVMNLAAGTHYPAAKVMNTAGSTGNQNRSGFLCSIARINGDGDVVEILRRTTPGTWRIRRQMSSPPGWFAAQILLRLVQEQQTRGCAGHGPITFSFSTVGDSAGVAWSGRQEISIPIGTQALDYVQQLVETGIDVSMSPGLTLNAWRQRGADRSGWIRLAPKVLDESAAQLPAIRNSAHARALSGWVGADDAGSIAARGRRETMITLGSSQSAEQTAASVSALLPDLANPPQTYEVKISGAAGGPQPYRDFDVADWVSARLLGHSDWQRVRVMSIAGEVTEAGHPDWTIQLYKD